jgi:hypothetical protein
MSRAIQDATACREALSRLPELNLGELRQQWRILYKTEASPHLSRDLLVRAVAYRMQEVALGGLRSGRQRQLHQITQQFKQTGAAATPRRPELKPGTRLVRGWQGQTYEVLVLDDGIIGEADPQYLPGHIAARITSRERTLPAAQRAQMGDEIVESGFDGDQRLDIVGPHLRARNRRNDLPQPADAASCENTGPIS